MKSEMKKLNLITLAILALAISTATAKSGPRRCIKVIVLKNSKAPIQFALLETKAPVLEPTFGNPDIHIATTSDYLNVSTNSINDDLMFRIYDADDNEIAQSEIRGGQTRLSLDELPAGEYITRTSLKSGGIVNVQKIQLMK
jgi:hypothetical protein